MEKKNLSAFRDYVKTKYRFAQMYANQLSKFGENNFRKKVFSIKSNLANDAIADEQLYIPINLARAVTRTFTNYVIGKGFSVDFGDEESNKSFVAMADELKLQNLLSVGSRFTPSDTPSRRLCTGPNTVSWKRKVAIGQAVYRGSQITSFDAQK